MDEDEDDDGEEEESEEEDDEEDIIKQPPNKMAKFEKGANQNGLTNGKLPKKDKEQKQKPQEQQKQQKNKQDQKQVSVTQRKPKKISNVCANDTIACSMLTGPKAEKPTAKSATTKEAIGRRSHH